MVLGVHRGVVGQRPSRRPLPVAELADEGHVVAPLVSCVCEMCAKHTAADGRRKLAGASRDFDLAVAWRVIYIGEASTAGDVVTQCMQDRDHPSTYKF